jgi:GTP-binding protein
VVGINKWERPDLEQREHGQARLERKMGFLSFAQQHFMSARDGKGIGRS